MNEAVILVHGLWLRNWALLPLCLRLARRGYRAQTFTYASLTQTLDAHAQRLAARLAALAQDKIHLVGHSFGGLVILRCLRNYGEQRIGRVVLMGTPVRACMAGLRVDTWRLGRPLLGKSREVWHQLPETFRPRSELGMIAGNRGRGLGHLFLRLPGISDGVVRLEEAEVRGMRARVVLPVAHTGMLVSVAVASQVAYFLQHGDFDYAMKGSSRR